MRRSLMEPPRVVAVGLLTKKEISLLGPTFDLLWPVEQTADFSELLDAIDAADDKLGLSRRTDPS